MQLARATQSTHRLLRTCRNHASHSKWLLLDTTLRAVHPCEGRGVCSPSAIRSAPFSALPRRSHRNPPRLNARLKPPQARNPRSNIHEKPCGAPINSSSCLSVWAAAAPGITKALDSGALRSAGKEALIMLSATSSRKLSKPPSIHPSPAFTNLPGTARTVAPPAVTCKDKFCMLKGASEDDMYSATTSYKVSDSMQPCA
mmetsp:Transcript_29771/g.74856  ORF Transcript_29771/g.74856 Transcript_29771/m.74856 type:complete len:200 (-) Transcript_29771:780-1379(-)